MSQKTSINETSQIRSAVEITLRLALLFLLLYWCYGIIKPFMDFFIWSIIFAVALYPGYDWLAGKLGGRKILSAVFIVGAMMLLFILPVVLFASSLYDGITFIKAQYESNGSLIPNASEQIASLPLIGPLIYEKWNALSTNTGEGLQAYAPQLKDVSLTVISSIASAGIGFVKLFISILIAGFLLVSSETFSKMALGLSTKLIGDHGTEYAYMAEKTIRTVVKGILGVAFIQSLLLGIGMVIVGVPAAGLLFMLSLILGIVQVGVFLVVIPVVIYVFATYSTTTAVLFLIWCIIISPLDNILKPILLGKGALVPMPVIFIGAIGGFIYSGFVGLFTGAIVFSVGYKLFIFWMDQKELDEKTAVK
ncbi:MAG: AI-2E family transporter [Prolixibacteraceae bacterium]